LLRLTSDGALLTELLQTLEAGADGGAPLFSDNTINAIMGEEMRDIAADVALEMQADAVPHFESKHSEDPCVSKAAPAVMQNTGAPSSILPEYLALLNGQPLCNDAGSLKTVSLPEEHQQLVLDSPSGATIQYVPVLGSTLLEPPGQAQGQWMILKGVPFDPQNRFTPQSEEHTHAAEQQKLVESSSTKDETSAPVSSAEDVQPMPFDHDALGQLPSFVHSPRQGLKRERSVKASTLQSLLDPSRSCYKLARAGTGMNMVNAACLPPLLDISTSPDSALVGLTTFGSADQFSPPSELGRESVPRYLGEVKSEPVFSPREPPLQVPQCASTASQPIPANTSTPVVDRYQQPHQFSLQRSRSIVNPYYSQYPQPPVNYGMPPVSFPILSMNGEPSEADGPSASNPQPAAALSDRPPPDPSLVAHINAVIAAVYDTRELAGGKKRRGRKPKESDAQQNDAEILQQLLLEDPSRLTMQPDALKKMVRKEKNRRSAAASRQRSLEYTSSLEARVEKLHAEQAWLTAWLQAPPTVPPHRFILSGAGMATSGGDENGFEMLLPTEPPLRHLSI
jgi:hypothetical protein